MLNKLSLKRGPDFIIIGVQKGGTSSLYFYLSQHPQINASKVKEIHFFDNNYSKGIDWYTNHFPAKNFLTKELTGEASPYYIFHPLVPERIYNSFPNVKLIVMLRDPIDRAYSHFNMQKKRGIENNSSFEEAIKMESDRIKGEYEKIKDIQNYNSYNYQKFSYLERSKYFQQLIIWLKFFPQKQFLFIKSEDFFCNPYLVLKEVYDFLGVNLVYPTSLEVCNSNKYDPMPNHLKETLKIYFEEDGNRLIDLLGENFCWK